MSIVEMTEKFVTNEEKEKLFKKFKRASNTPVIKVGNSSMAHSAWDDVRRYMDELAQKYDVETERSDGSKFSVNKEGRIVFARH